MHSQAPPGPENQEPVVSPGVCVFTSPPGDAEASQSWRGTKTLSDFGGLSCSVALV